LAAQRSILSGDFWLRVFAKRWRYAAGDSTESEQALRGAQARAHRCIGERTRRASGRGAESQLVGCARKPRPLTEEVERTQAELNTAGAPPRLPSRAGPAISGAAARVRRSDPEAKKPTTSGYAWKTELARVREEIAAAQTAQTAASAHAADLRERAGGLAAERDRPMRGLECSIRTGSAGSARERRCWPRSPLLMEETRSAHLHLEGLWRGVVSLDASRARAFPQEREEPRNGTGCVESELRLAEQEERDAATGRRASPGTRLAQIEARARNAGLAVRATSSHDEECADVESRYRDEADAVVEELPTAARDLARFGIERQPQRGGRAR